MADEEKEEKTSKKKGGSVVLIIVVFLFVVLLAVVGLIGFFMLKHRQRQVRRLGLLLDKQTRRAVVRQRAQRGGVITQI